jgi:hypothetical protein
MGWSTTSDLDRFAGAAGGYLRARAAENTLLLSAAAQAQTRPQGAGLLFGWWTPSDGDEPRGAFVHDPAVPLLISGRVPEMAAALAVTLARLGRQVCGVDAPTEAADAFAAAWSQRAGTVVRAHRMCRVYRLAAAQGAAGQGRPLQATPPQGMPAAPGDWPPPALPGQPGRLRVAVPEDHTMLADWLRAAAIEAAERLASPSDLAADLISYGGAVFWEVPRTPGPGRFRGDAAHTTIPHHREGEPVPQPVALATLTRPVAGSVRFSMVYTLPEHRRSGYAAGLIQAVSRALLWGGGPGAAPGMLGHGCVRELVMITDKNRPDRWGGRFGYQLVSERSLLRFGPATGAVPRARSTSELPRLPTGPLPRLPRRGNGSGW